MRVRENRTMLLKQFLPEFLSLRRAHTTSIPYSRDVPKNVETEILHHKTLRRE
jgi:hypothetical protein